MEENQIGNAKFSAAKLLIGEYEAEISFMLLMQIWDDLLIDGQEKEEAMLTILANSECYTVRLAASRQLYIAESIFNILVIDPQQIVRSSLAKNHSAARFYTDSHIQTIMDENDVQILTSLAAHMPELKISEEMKSKFKAFLITHKDPAVRLSVMASYDYEHDDFDTLINDPDRIIISEMVHKMEMEEGL